MGYKAYLQCGANKLHLDANPYELAFGFVPPAVTETPNIGIGTSANQYGGGKLISKRTESGAYSFSVRVMGSSNAHNEALIDRLDRFIRSGTDAEPVYFCWRPADNVDAEPLYGQFNATRRAKVITGSVYKSAEYYSRGTIRDSVIFADVNMVINPPEGKRQRVATATGGIIEDTIGTTDGTSRGVIVAEATTNVITNPIFGHSTPLNDWTVGADTIGEVVTDDDFVLFGDNALRVTRKTSGSTFSVYQSINVGGTATWCLSFYAKKPDSSAVTAADIRPRYGATTPSDSTYTPVGNGWYRVYDTFTGIASAQVTGFTSIVAGVSIYVDGFQFEEKAYPTPLAYGDQLGCSWAGTAHDSTTTRVVSSLRIPAAECIQPSNFTWWLAFRANCAFSEFASARVLLREDATNAYINAETTGQLSFSYDGSNGCAGAATAIAAGDIVVVHATMDSAGLKLYRNGAADGAGTATFAPLASSTYLYVGSNETPGGHSNATILGAGTYNKALTAAEIALDYANLYQAARGMDGYGGRVDWIPYLWTQAGDNVVENCDGATYDNWCVIASIPGSIPAATRIDATVSTGFDDNYQVNLSCPTLPYRNFVSPSLWLNCDASGTAAVGTTQGDAYEATSVTTSTVNLLTFTPVIDYDALKNIEYYLFARIWDAGSGLSLRSDLAVGNTIATTGLTAVSSAAEWRMTQLPKLASWRNAQLFDDVTEWYPGVSLLAQRASGTADVRVDFVQIMPRPFVTIFDNVTSMGRFIYEKNKALIVEVSGSILFPNTIAKVTGDVIEFAPGVYNELVSLMGNDDLDTTIDVTLTYNNIYITPRWALA